MIIKTIMSVAGNSSSNMLGEDDEGKRFDLAVNIGSIYEKMNEIVSSNLKVYYDENYNCRKRIVRKMLSQKNS